MEKYDISWDSDDDSGDAFEKKYKEWESRKWLPWLKKNLTFPFKVERMEDEDDAYFTDIADHEPFRLGHTMEITGIALADDFYGIIVNAKEGKRKGQVPLCDLEVRPKGESNFWLVREYVVWFANR